MTETLRMNENIVHIVRQRIVKNDRTTYASACGKTFWRTRERGPEYEVPTCVPCLGDGWVKYCVKCKRQITTWVLGPYDPERCVRCADYDPADPDNEEST